MKQLYREQSRAKSKMKIHLFGSMKVLYKEQEMSFRSDKIRGLLVYLIVHRQRPISRAKLTELLWGEQPEKQAKANLRTSLTRLRKALSPIQEGLEQELLLTDRQQVTFTQGPEQVWCDIDAFEKLIDACWRFPQREWWRRLECVKALQKLQALYTGPFLEGLDLSDTPTFGEWKTGLVEKYHQQAITALETLGNHYLALTLHEEVRKTCGHLLELESWNEEAHRLLIRSYLLTGEKRSAHRQYETCCEILREELGIEPEPSTKALGEQCTRKNRHHQEELFEGYLPREKTPFIGRKKAFRSILPRLLDPAYPILTILGPGGIGKSRLAREVARRMQEHFAEGVWFVSLIKPQAMAATEEQLKSIYLEQLCLQIARVLDYRFFGKESLVQQLLTFLQDKEILLVLDSFEHFIEKAEVLVEFIEKLPLLKILVTTRERLYLQMESVLELGGLETIEIAEQSFQSAWLELESLRLFSERAQRHAPSFQLNAQNAPEVLAICRALDGMPLAIELASSWMYRYSLSQILQNIQSNLDFLETPMRDVSKRHRSIRLLLMDSWEALTQEEKSVFSKLGVFQGDFSQDAVLQITATSSAALSRLAQCFLIKESGEERYLMHDLVRMFALEYLANSPKEKEIAHQQHAQYYLEQLKALARQLSSQQAKEASQTIRKNFSQIEAAWQWILEQQKLDELIEYSHWFEEYYYITQLAREGMMFFLSSARVLEAAEKPMGERISHILSLLYSASANMAKRLGKYQQMDEATQKALKHAANQSDEHISTRAHLERGMLLQIKGKSQEGLALVEQSERESRELPDTPQHCALRNKVLGGLSVSYLKQSILDKGLKFVEEGLALARSQKNISTEGQCLTLKARYLRDQGNLLQAKETLLQAIQQTEYIGGSFQLVLQLHLLGIILRMQGEYEEAIQQLSRGQKYTKTFGIAPIWSVITLSQAANYINLGQWEEAERCYDEVIEKAHLSEDLSALAHGFCNRYFLYVEKGDKQKLQEVESQTREWVAQSRNKRLQDDFLMYTGLGDLLQRDTQSAKKSLLLARERYHQANRTNRYIEASAELARALVMENAPQEAMQYAEEPWSSLKKKLKKGSESLQTYFSFYQVLRANQHPDAQELLEHSYQLLMKRYKKLSNRTNQKTYLAIPYHKEIVRYWEDTQGSAKKL
mgnify:CR=1 FL=1